MCGGCARPASVCLCQYFSPVTTRTRVVILQHPRESTVPIGTARLAERVLRNFERHVGVEFAGLVRPGMLLFPGEGARDLQTQAPSVASTLFVIDGTWSQAKKILKKNPELAQLPRYALTPAAPSRYRIRREPAAHCLSTIEAIVAALSVLEGDASLPQRLLPAFEALVEKQLWFASQRRAHRHLTRKGPRSAPALPRAFVERSGRLVVAYGEANAWPRGSESGKEPQIVHWAAERLATGERFEAFIQPRGPLAPSFSRQTGIPSERVLSGLTWPVFCAAWRRFLEPGDLLCSWGWFASELLKRHGAELPEQIDLRTVARDFLRGKVGQVEHAATWFDDSAREAWVEGRTGVRLAGLTALARALASVAAQPTAGQSEAWRSACSRIRGTRTMNSEPLPGSLWT
jgi:DTW domain-containing protein